MERTFTPTTNAPNAVKAVARFNSDSLNGPVSLNFGPLAGVHTANVERYAIAMSSGGTGAGLISLDPNACPGLYINGTVAIDVNDGDMQVNADGEQCNKPCAVDIDGQPEIMADSLNVVGGYCPGVFEEDFPVNTGVDPIPDPLCPDPPDVCIPPPTWNEADDLTPQYDPNLLPGDAIQINEGDVVLEPGYYSGGLRITGGNVIMKPGIYILDGTSQGLTSGLVVAGNTNLCARGVMFYITGDGVVDLAGTGAIEVTPMTFDEPQTACDGSLSFPDGAYAEYEGISFFQDRDNTNEARITGTNLLDLDGTLYFSSNPVALSGTGDGFGNQLIAGTVEIKGTADITINYDGRNPAPGHKSYLVE
jgi:hypothetical protein